MEKFIIEKEDKEAVYLMYADEDGDVMVEGAYLTPYIEPDREKAAADAFQRGYEHAKHECADCRRIRAGAEQELADKAYQQGMNDLWEAMQKAIKMYCEIDNEVFLRVFYDVKCDWGESVLQALFKNTPQHLIDSIRKYEQRQEEEIQIGDEVIAASGKAVVTAVGPVYFEFVYANGAIGSDKVKNVKKTGRHFPEIAEVMQKMKEEE